MELRTLSARSGGYWAWRQQNTQHVQFSTNYEPTGVCAPYMYSAIFRLESWPNSQTPVRPKPRSAVRGYPVWTATGLRLSQSKKMVVHSNNEFAADNIAVHVQTTSNFWVSVNNCNVPCVSVLDPAQTTGFNTAPQDFRHTSKKTLRCPSE
jgi:hypothetical protein